MNRSDTGRRVHVIATQHLDVAWLWTRVPQGEDLMRQCFERAIETIEAHPEAHFVFSRSTAWSFWIVQQRYPKLFEQVKRYVEQDRIELCGGEWVEPDHLIPSGESLVRQVALGQWYYEETFGKTASVCWVPDIFGHANTLPQIMRKTGLEGYYFHRCRPHDTQGRPLYQFVWEGLDGSRILGLSGRWVGRPDAAVVRTAAEELAETGLPATHLVTGLRSDRRITIKPDWAVLPTASEKATDLPGCRWSSAKTVLEDMQSYADRLPVVSGELGFQFTGTYTSNGYNKRAVRRLEALLLDAEKAASWALLYGFPYPAEQLTQAWRDLCVNQFHDIICGCSYASVHAEDRALFAEVERRTRWVLDQAVAFINTRMLSNSPEHSWAVFDWLAWPRKAPVILPAESGAKSVVSRRNGRSVPAQPVTSEDGKPGLLVLHESAGIGCTHYQVQAGASPAPTEQVHAEGLTLENATLRVEIDKSSGDIVRLYDKRSGYECLPPGGRANRLELLRDAGEAHTGQPHTWEPWNFSYTGEILPTPTVSSVHVVESGPLRAIIRVERRAKLHADMPETIIIQDIVLHSHEPLLRFETRGTWHTAQATLKARFDLPLSGAKIAVEAPYGVAERAPHNVSSATGVDADSAAEDRRAEGGQIVEPDRYMQKWLDVSDGKHGLLFLNNGKYGYDASEQQVGITLMRAPIMRQGEITGLGPFEFSYAIMPHPGDWRAADAPRRGYEFNHIPLVTQLQSGVNDGVGCQWWDFLPHLHGDIPSQFLQTTGNGVLVTVVKQAETGHALVLRLVETLGYPSEAQLTFGHPVRSAAECDMLERVPGSGPCSITVSQNPLVSGSAVTVQLDPFEIKTVRVEF